MNFKSYCSESAAPNPQLRFCPECGNRDAEYVGTDVLHCRHCNKEVNYNNVNESMVQESVKMTKMVPQTIMVCPCCHEEIQEKGSWCPDFKNHPQVMVHRSCGGCYRFPHDPEAEKALAGLWGHGNVHEGIDEARKPKKIPVTATERDEIKTRFGTDLGCSFARDKDGIYCYTHRSRSKSYPSVSKIPKSKVKFIGSTG